MLIVAVIKWPIAAVFGRATIKGVTIGNNYIAAVLNRSNIIMCYQFKRAYCCGLAQKPQQYALINN